MTNAHMLYSPVKGVNHARNLGIVHARGEVLLFLDDDCRLPHTHYLQTVIELHALHPHQVSMGGTYKLPKKSSWFARAYHYNQQNWLASQKCGSDRSRVLLGGNASYKKTVFQKDLRFSPGIKYGGSETPLNNQIFQTHGAHHFYPSLTLEHASHLTPWTFVKKAYLQGKGSAFQKKFYSSGPMEWHAPAGAPPFPVRLLLWLYDICFMIGYRTSIYERRHWITSFFEEVTKRLISPWQPVFTDIRAARDLAFSKPLLSLTHMSSADSAQIVRIGASESLFKKLKQLTEKDLLEKSIALPLLGSADALYRDLQKIQRYFGRAPETFNFANIHRTPAKLVTHNVGDFVFVFSPEFSSNYESWDRDRVELSSLKAQVVYLFSQPQDINKTIWPHKLHPSFFPLDGMAVRTSVWIDYITSNADPLNHFSWSAYANAHISPPQHLPLKVGHAQNIKTLQSHARTHFFNFPTREFYRDNMVLLGNSCRRRSILLKFFLLMRSVSDRLPEGWIATTMRASKHLLSRVHHWQLEAQETSSLAYKWTAYALHRTYWFLHKTFWVANEVYWFFYKIVTFAVAQIVWRSFDALMFLYLKLNNLYWRMHVLCIGPALGFLVSLFDEPASIKQLPPRERFKQRTLLFMRKWAWLFLRGARLR